MELFQHIIVFLIFAVALGYLFTKLIWMPPFLKKKRASKGSCGSSDCGCH
jgi:hypothetical protein